MKKKAAIAIVGLVVATLAGMMPSQAADVVYASGPLEQFKGYLLPALVIPAGTPVDYFNGDITAHSVVADMYGPDKPWCAQAGTQPGKCPKFGSHAMGALQRGPIYEIENLAPGTYTFHCAQHPTAQKGTLVVI